jgi:mannose-6-phosphate isomerase-like protein (cupin superfamily)
MLLRSIPHAGKGWFAGPWDSNVPVALGYSDVGVDEPHTHHQMHEIYLIARGTSVAVVNGSETPLAAGDMLVIEPGEQHTIRESSEDYLHFVVQAPFTPGDKSASGPTPTSRNSTT